VFVLAKNLSTFCPCPGTLHETEFKGGELVNLIEAAQHSGYSTGIAKCF
jgi:hypothetical protein